MFVRMTQMAGISLSPCLCQVNPLIDMTFHRISLHGLGQARANTYTRYSYTISSMTLDRQQFNLYTRVVINTTSMTLAW